MYAEIEDDTIQFGQKRLVRDFNDSDCLLHFRWRKARLQTVADKLWPRLEPHLEGTALSIRCDNNYKAPYETCLLIYLARMSYPHRLRPDLERLFGMRKSHISACIQTFSSALYQVATRYLHDVGIWAHRMPYYAERISSKLDFLMGNIWGFIDGTIRRVRRPIRFQRQVYTGYRRCHALKFQSVITPDGFIAHLAGPFMGRDHDSRILAESLLLEALQDLMPLDGSGGPIFALYSDLAYPFSNWLMKGFVNPPRGSLQARFNTLMSSCRVAVEWGFKNILQLWQFLDFHRSAMILKMPVGQYFANAAFLTNLHTCDYGNQISEYFVCAPLSLDQYLDLVPVDDD